VLVQPERRDRQQQRQQDELGQRVGQAGASRSEPRGQVRGGARRPLQRRPAGCLQRPREGERVRDRDGVAPALA
jgi:hypothetical protein